MAMASADTATGDGSISIPQEDSPPLGNRITTAADDHGQLNLVSLPDDVLELLFKMLPVADRGRLACTCSRLSEVIHWPSVWRDFSICLSTTPSSFCNTGSIGEMDRAVIRKYSKFFRHVEISIPCAVLTRESFDLLAQLCERRVIRKVILVDFVAYTISSALTMPNNFQPTVPEFIQLLEGSTPISLTLSRTHFLLMQKLHPQTVSEKCVRMTRNMVLAGESRPERDLARLMLKQSAPTASFISIFPALQVLQMNIVNLSDELLLELSDTSGRRCQLKRLIIQDINKETRHYPQLSSAAWSRLTAASPSLQVECSVRHGGFGRISNVIKPETPLVKLEAIFHTEIDIKSILALCDLCKQHSSTLQYFGLSGGNSLRSSRICPQTPDIGGDFISLRVITHEHETTHCRDRREVLET